MLVRHDNKQKRLTQCDFAEASIEDRVPLRLSPHSNAFIESVQQIVHGSLTHTGIFCWHLLFGIVSTVSDPTTYHASSSVFAFL